MLDVVIIGAGVVGCAVAARLSQYTGKIAVVDKACDVAEGASKANSGIVHAGYDAKPGTEKARLNVKGAQMMESLCKALNVPYSRPGAMVLAFNEEEHEQVLKLNAQAVQNGVPGCRVIQKEEILRLEKNVNPDVYSALLVEQSGLVSPYELTFALADTAKENGAQFHFDHKVTGLSHRDGVWHVQTSQGDFEARAVINCAGVYGAQLHNLISTKHLHITPRRGQYYLLDRMAPLPFNMTMFQAPTKMGKGVLVSPTTHGNLLLGPTAEDIEDGNDVSTTKLGLQDVLMKVRKTWPTCNLRTVITAFSGIRAHEDQGDFVIGQVEGAPEGAFEAIGIESPGLTAAPAIGEEMGDWIAYYLQLGKRSDYVAPTPLPKPFARMSDEERARAFEQNPAYGRIICRCEQVTEAEIRHAIRRPVGATTIDGVKRRTRAGMGRCQGGFCMARVTEILAEELKRDVLSITKSGAGSYVLEHSIGAEKGEN